ncbi:MAG: hypothetical protein R2695_16890 [Acidimicrobiales bacterium]
MTALDALTPGLRSAFTELVDQVWDGRVDPTLLERCRQRVCGLVGAPADAGRHQSRPEAAGDSPALAACLAFTELWVVDPHAVDDATAAAVRAHLTDAEVAAFTIGLATIEAQARAAVALDAIGAPT